MQRRHRQAHGRIWLVLAVLLPALFAGSLLLRPGATEVEGVGRLAPAPSNTGSSR